MEQRLKERLFGAIIIIALFVIFLPMVLKEPDTSALVYDEAKPKPELQAKEDWLEVPKELATWEETVPKTMALSQAQKEAWVVQLATFANKANANKLVNRLKSKGYEAYLEAVPGSEETLTWVMVGPQDDKEKADKLKSDLKASFKMEGIVLSAKAKG